MGADLMQRSEAGPGGRAGPLRLSRPGLCPDFLVSAAGQSSEPPPRPTASALCLPALGQKPQSSGVAEGLRWRRGLLCRRQENPPSPGRS